jgi:hypothetical protein
MFSMLSDFDDVAPPDRAPLPTPPPGGVVRCRVPVSAFTLDPGDEFVGRVDADDGWEFALSRIVAARQAQRLVEDLDLHELQSMVEDAQTMTRSPIVARRAGNDLVIVDGLRRVAAAMLLLDRGAASVDTEIACPVVVVDDLTHPALVLALCGDPEDISPTVWDHGQHRRLIELLRHWEGPLPTAETLDDALCGDLLAVRRYRSLLAVRALLRARPDLPATLQCFAVLDEATTRAPTGLWMEWNAATGEFRNADASELFFEMITPCCGAMPRARRRSDVARLCDALLRPEAMDRLLAGESLEGALGDSEATEAERMQQQLAAAAESLRWDRRRFGRDL